MSTCPHNRNRASGTTSALELYKPDAGYWDVRTDCCGSDSTFIADHHVKVCRCCWDDITQWRNFR